MRRISFPMSANSSLQGRSTPAYYLSINVQIVVPRRRRSPRFTPEGGAAPWPFVPPAPVLFRGCTYGMFLRGFKMRNDYLRSSWSARLRKILELNPARGSLPLRIVCALFTYLISAFSIFPWSFLVVLTRNVRCFNHYGILKAGCKNILPMRSNTIYWGRIQFCFLLNIPVAAMNHLLSPRECFSS